jgi:hypothetical protein
MQMVLEILLTLALKIVALVHDLMLMKEVIVKIRVMMRIIF